MKDKSTNSRREQAEDRISELKKRNFEVTQWRRTKKRESKRAKQTYVICKTPSKEPISQSLEFQKKEERERGYKAY